MYRWESLDELQVLSLESIFLEEEGIVSKVYMSIGHVYQITRF